MADLETLKKVEYTSLTQFLEDINRNFAVIQNSPLYKGIPGKSITGNTGATGTRGSEFIFVKYSTFNTVFPDELTSGSKITLSYINTKLSTYTDKAKLYTALGVTEFVNNDIVVLTNSTMLSYDLTNDVFVDTGIAFNAETNLVSSIETQIETLVEEYVSSNSTIASIKNIFADFASYAKSYADTNNTYITTELTDSSVYVPYIAGLTNTTNGVLLSDHTYFGFTDTLFPRTNNGTIIFGSIKKYVDLLVNTLDSTDNETLTSDYAPGVDNIPIAVFLQDTANNGILIGRKAKTNLKTFASIYKNSDDALVIKSDSGPATDDDSASTEFSRLIISKSQLTYDKAVHFLNNLKVYKDYILVGNISSKYINTNEYTSDSEDSCLELGINDDGTNIVRFIGSNIQLPNFGDSVLVTNTNGKLIADYYVEDTAMVSSETTALTQISNMPNASLNGIITNKYITFLCTKFNRLTTLLSNNYWDISDFTLELNTLDWTTAITGLNTMTLLPSNSTTKVPTSTYLYYLYLKMNNVVSTITSNYPTIADLASYNNSIWILKNFHVGTESLLLINASTTGNSIAIGNSSSDTRILGSTIKTGFASNVLVTDANGYILNTYSIMTDVIDSTTYSTMPDASGSTNQVTWSDANTGAYRVVTGVSLKWIIAAINAIKVRFQNTYTLIQSQNAFGMMLQFSGRFYVSGSSLLRSGAWDRNFYSLSVSQIRVSEGSFILRFATSSTFSTTYQLSLYNYFVEAFSTTGTVNGIKTCYILKDSTYGWCIHIIMSDDLSANDGSFQLNLYLYGLGWKISDPS